MKQIFDWLREQMEEAKFPITDCKVCVKANGIQVTDDAVLYERANEIINEAEAKWEGDCCEWKKSLVYGYIKNPHTGRIFSNEPSMQNVYCNTCGKPIKIMEVEL